MSMSSECSIAGGHIQLILGPMFSGKTTELMRRVKRYTVAQHRCCVIKYKNDTRYSEDCASTHDKQTLKAISAAKLSEIGSGRLDEMDVVAIDEGQFFPDVVEFAEQMANLGKIVIVSALDGTFERKAFGSILQLVPLAEQVVKLNAVCMICHKEAAFSKRLGTETAVEVIGGADKYVSACRACFFGAPKTTGKRKTPGSLHVAPEAPASLSASVERKRREQVAQDENAGASSGDDSDKENSAAAAASATESAAKRRKTSLGGASSGSSSKGEAASGSSGSSGIECASPGSPSCAKRPAFLESGGSPSTPVADRRPLGSLSGNVPVSPA